MSEIIWEPSEDEQLTESYIEAKEGEIIGRRINFITGEVYDCVINNGNAVWIRNKSSTQTSA